MNGEPETSLSARINIITYEWGLSVKSLLYMQRFPQDKNAHLSNAKLELADLLTQLDILINDLDLDRQELLRLGRKHLSERYKEFEKNNWQKL